MKTTRRIDSIENGIVIDHIQVGNGMKIYNLLKLDAAECTVVLIRNARSERYGRKDVIKIEGDIQLNLDLLGYVDHHVTVCFIKGGEIVEKKKLTLPKSPSPPKPSVPAPLPSSNIGKRELRPAFERSCVILRITKTFLFA